ncbi:MAG: sigma-70 family RNA polymerase sigma factor [Phycisphaerae bacterium]
MTETCIAETGPAVATAEPPAGTESSAREGLPPYTPEQLLQIAERITAHYDPADKEDSAQEFVLEALQAAKRAKPGTLMRSYQWACGMGRVKNFLTKKTRRLAKVRVILDAPAGDGTSSMTKGDLVPDPKAINPATFSDAADLRHELRALVDALPDERMRFILRERFWRGRELGAIGADLCLTAERTRQLMEEALAKIRRIIIAGGISA